MVREPLNRCIEALGVQVFVGPERRELLAVVEERRTQRRVRHGADALVFIGKGKEVRYLKHGHSIGYFTGTVNGFLTDAM